MNIAKYAKFITALCGAVTTAVADGVFDVNDGITIALAAATVLGVYAVPNAKP